MVNNHTETASEVRYKSSYLFAVTARSKCQAQCVAKLVQFLFLSSVTQLRPTLNLSKQCLQLPDSAASYLSVCSVLNTQQEAGCLLSSLQSKSHLLLLLLWLEQ